jgi:diadenosine tetraphosphate (Ap4A) HIT family hydrolase
VTAPACDLCARIERTERGENPFAVARTTTGYVALGDAQYYEGYTVFAAKRCVGELHLLPGAERDAHLHEMALVAEAVFTAFEPRKLNYELLGNAVPHLHWHLFPRHAADPRAIGPVWEDPEFVRANNSGERADLGLVAGLKARLLPCLEATGLTIEERFLDIS